MNTSSCNMNINQVQEENDFNSSVLESLSKFFSPSCDYFSYSGLFSQAEKSENTNQIF